MRVSSKANIEWIQRLHQENEKLRAANEFLLSFHQTTPSSYRRTGWSEIDALFDEAEKLNKELRTIQAEYFAMLKA